MSLATKLRRAASRCTKHFRINASSVIIVFFAMPVQAIEPNGTPFNGALPGEFSVSPTGAATYSIPIEVPPGIGGMQPNLSLEYNSQSGNGLLGVGWSLGGLSAITRCPATLAQDGFIDGVDFDGNDRFCLNGQRLVQVTNTGCSGGTEYRTEIDSYARICAFGTQGNGPAWFKVWSKAGQVMEYGNTADSRLGTIDGTSITSWSVNGINDSLGNEIWIVYGNGSPASFHRPLILYYGGNSGLGISPSHSIRFLYESRPDELRSFGVDVESYIPQRISGIEIHGAGGLQTNILVQYDTSPTTARSRISTISKCDNSSCEQKVSFSWQDITAGLNLTSQSETLHNGGSIRITQVVLLR